MLDRFVSYFSLTVVLASVLFLGCYAVWTASGVISQGDGLFGMGACVLAAMVFAYQYSDPTDVEAISVIKSA